MIGLRHRFFIQISKETYPGYEYQDYKDKGFNLKLRIKEEGVLPAIAVGINDLAGTGLYGSEYVVGSYGINNFDFHFGLGWGAYNGSEYSFENPLVILMIDSKLELMKILVLMEQDHSLQVDTFLIKRCLHSLVYHIFLITEYY